MAISGYRLGLACLAAAGSVTLAVNLAGPASAAATPSRASFPHYDHARHADQIWGGYADTGARFTSISGDWTVPTLNCSSVPNSSVSPWIGIDGFNSDTVEQIGFDQDCQNGVAGYYPWVEMYPADSIYFTETVKAGDHITASVSVSGSSWTLTEKDTTRGWSKTFHESGSDKLSSAEAIVEDLGNGIQPVAPFSAITFTSLTADGKSLASAGTVNSTNIERGNTPLTKNSSLSGGTFKLSWLHS
ncbi:G1 family glutamic endopeptidase [Catenulispora pinisilvae]|uniref:G1 family glutamic endopeptidase n=1 Tax=Catenulispora pinisilvae TaxID=2705253 RepID=UPI0018920791|nr:G1 family glutamic endopeptidase [Catenulispora pinisilvae]